MERKNMGPSEKHARDTMCNLNPQAMKPAMKFGTFKHGWQVPEP